MNGARRLLILGGIALALWGMSYGLWYAVFAEHQALDGIGISLATGFGPKKIPWRRKLRSSSTGKRSIDTTAKLTFTGTGSDWPCF
jgi:hypothetical protein